MVLLISAPSPEEFLFENVDEDGDPVPFPSLPLKIQVVDRVGSFIIEKDSGMTIEGNLGNLLRVRFTSEETSLLASKRQPLTFSIYKETPSGRVLVASGVIIAHTFVFPTPQQQP